MSIGTKIDLMSNGLKEKAQNEGWWDDKTTFNWTEGSLISESFSLRLKFSKKVPNHYPENLLFRQWIGIWLLSFGDLSRST